MTYLPMSSTIYLGILERLIDVYVTIIFNVVTKP